MGRWVCPHHSILCCHFSVLSMAHFWTPNPTLRVGSWDRGCQGVGWGHIGGTVGVGVGMGGLGNQGPGLRLLTCGLVEGLGVMELGDLGLGIGGVVEPGREDRG